MKIFSTFCVIALLIGSGLRTSAQALPAGTTNRGTDFWLSFPVSYSPPSTYNSLKIYVTCEVTTNCTVEIPALGYKETSVVHANTVKEFSITPKMGQPYEKDATPGGALAEQVLSGRGIHVSAPVPISVYGVSRFANTSDSFLALPTSALGKEYIVASYAEGTGNSANQHLMSQTVIVAAFDNTILSFKLGGRPGTETVGGMKIGQVKTFSMKKGDVIVFANKKINGIYGDISGSKVTATKPVAVISGNQCAYVDLATTQCDYIAEMELPTTSWGKEYHVTSIKDRKSYSYVKIFAKEPDTKLYRDGNPTPFAVISTSGGAMNAGYFEGRIFNDGSSPRPISIRADKPISVTQFNPGQSDDNIPAAPFQMVLTPVEEYQREIIFSVPGFTQNNMNVVFEANADGSMPDDLEFGTLNFKNEVEWKSLKSVFNSNTEPFKNFSGDTKKYFQKTITLSKSGTYRIRALKPFAAYLYGYGTFDSYGHPASVSVRDLTLPDSTKPSPQYTLECGGSVQDGSVSELPDDPATRSNLSLVTLLAGSKNYILDKSEFVPGDDSASTWKLRVEDQSRDATAHVYFADRAGNDTTVTINYASPRIAFKDSTLNFGFLKVDESKTMTLELQNMSQTDSQTITAMRIKGSYGFTLAGAPSFPLLLQPLEKKTFEIHFSTSKQVAGLSDSILIELNGCSTIGAKLHVRTGSEPLLEVSDADFGTSTVNTEAFKTIKLTNLGTFPVIITGYTGPNTPEFTLTGWPVISENSPYVLDYGEVLPLIVIFNAGAEGEYSGEIVFKSNAHIEGTDSIGKLSAIAQATVGVNEIENPVFKISPNPATGFATITLPAFKTRNVFLKIFDAAGNEVADFSNDLLKTELRFDTKTLPNGAYFIRLMDGKSKLSKAFVVQN